MTPETILDTACKRSGFTYSSTTHKVYAVQYLNDELNILSNYTDWLWMYSVGTIALTLAGGSLVSLTETTIIDITHAWNVTDNCSVGIVPIRDVDMVDPDVDQTGIVTKMSVVGLDTTTGQWEVYFYPIVGKSITVKYRFYQRIPKVVTTTPATGEIQDTETDLDLYMPPGIQPGLYMGVAASFLESKMAFDAAQEMRKAQDIVYQRAALRNARAMGTSTTRLGERRRTVEMGDQPVIYIGTIS